MRAAVVTVLGTVAAAALLCGCTGPAPLDEDPFPDGALAALADLLAAFADPDVEATGPCDAVAPDPLVVWLHHEGGIAPVRAPVDSCLRPLPRAVEAWDDLPRTRLVTASETEGFPNG